MHFDLADYLPICICKLIASNSAFDKSILIMTDILNLESLTFDAYLKLRRLDKTLVRTPDYMGLAYFWHHDFRFHLRDASYAKRRKIHNQWLKQGIDFDHPCDTAWNIVRKITGLN